MYKNKFPVLVGAAVAAFSFTASAGTVAHGDDTGMMSAPDQLSTDWRPMLQKGTQELSVGGRLQLKSFEDVSYDLRLKYGWFIKDRWEVGVTADMIDFGSDQAVNLGGFTEYNFDFGKRWIPYIGAAIKWSHADFNNLDEDAVSFSGELGVKYFFRPSMAIYGAINFDWSPDDIFSLGDDISDNAQNVIIGMRFYF